MSQTDETDRREDLDALEDVTRQGVEQISQQMSEEPQQERGRGPRGAAGKLHRAAE